MPSFCAVVGCGSRGNRDSRSFYRFPTVPLKGSEKVIQLCKERREKWIEALKRDDLTDTALKYSRICDKHFVNGCPARKMDFLNPDWIPSVRMGYTTEKLSFDRYNRSKLRSEASTSEVGRIDPDDDDTALISDVGRTDTVDDSTALISDVGIMDSMNEDTLSIPENTNNCIEIQTDLTMDYVKKMEEVINQQTEEIVKLKEKLNNYIVNEESYKDDKKTKFYTGLETFQTLMIIFNLVSKDLIETSRSSLTKFEQLILTLQRLRLNLSLSDLGYRYGVSVNTASRVFQNCVYVLYKKLKMFIIWPEREDLRRSMPSVFLDAFGARVSVIIDCFEIKTEKPSNLLSSAQVWSNYKQHHTIKFLIGICPQGSISFISQGWGGRTSDKEIALQCGILEKLLPGDIVISDRGFLIKDAVGLYCAEVQMPIFTRGKKQLSPLEVEKNRNLSHVRIHVERVIGSLRQKYQILHSVLPIHVMKTQAYEDAPSLINQIVTVCCGLINFCPTVVPLN